MSLNTQDWINITIATGTCAAAIFSWLSAKKSSESAEVSQQQSERHATDEKVRWLSSTLIDVAERCNTVVSPFGIVNSSDPDLSKMITNIYHSIELIEDYDFSLNHAILLKRTLWSFLHTSIRIEITERIILEKKKPGENEIIEFPESVKFYNTLKDQYDFVRNKLINVVVRQE